MYFPDLTGQRCDENTQQAVQHESNIQAWRSATDVNNQLQTAR